MADRLLPALGSVVLLYVSITLAWFLVLPPFEGPDELQHYDYARYIATTGHLPDRAPAVVNEGGYYTGMWVHEGLYYWLLAQVLVAVDATGAPPAVVPNPRARYTGGPEAPSFLHAVPLPPDLARAVLAGRLLNASFGFGTILCVFFALEAVTRRPSLAGAGAGCLMLVPEFGVRAACISNDPLATLLASAAALWVLRWRPERAPWWHAAAVGAIAGAAMATKMPAAAIVPMLPVACWLARRDRGVQPLRHLLAYAAGLIVGGAWPFVRSWVIFGDPMAMPIKRATIAQLHYQPGFDAADWRAYPEFARLVYRSFWATVGWSGFRPPSAWIWGVFAAWSVACGAAFARVLFRRREAFSSVAWRAATTSVVVVGAALVVFIVSASRFPGHSARYLLPVTIPAMVVVIEGLRDLAGRGRPRLGDAAIAWLAWAGVIALSLAWLGTFREVLLAYHFGVTS